MPFYKSKNATISERLTGMAKEEGFEAARKLVQSGRLGLSQKEADSWLQKELIKRNWWKVVCGIVTLTSGITTVWEIFFK
jgi:ubiquinone/menaquinone biosynthesis C-methylase UbiE